MEHYYYDIRLVCGVLHFRKGKGNVLLVVYAAYGLFAVGGEGETVQAFRVTQECGGDTIYLYGAQILSVLFIAVCSHTYHIAAVVVVECGTKSVLSLVQNVVVCHSEYVKAQLSHMISQRGRGVEGGVCVRLVLVVCNESLLVDYGYISLSQLICHIFVGIFPVVVHAAGFAPAGGLLVQGGVDKVVAHGSVAYCDLLLFRLRDGGLLHGGGEGAFLRRGGLCCHSFGVGYSVYYLKLPAVGGGTGCQHDSRKE